MKKLLSIGLKLFSSNVHLAKEAGKLYDEGIFSFTELYIVPQTFKKSIKIWKSLKCKFVIHAPHFSYNFNLSKPEAFRNNKVMLQEAKQYADALEAGFIIIHPGLSGSYEETISQVKRLYDRKLLIENKPFIALNGKRCVGSSYEEIREIISQTGIGLCLDIGHAIKHAFSHDIDPYKFILKMMKLCPRVIHLCDGKTKGFRDLHLNIGQGNYELNMIIKIIKVADKKRRVLVTLETPRNDKNRLNDFLRDVRALRSIEAKL